MRSPPPPVSGFKRAARRARKPMVLLAVGDDFARGQYVASLSDNEFTVVDTARGGDAVALAGRLLPELVVVDLDLPGLTGLNVVRHLRSEPTTMDAGIIALSRGVTPYREGLAQQAGCDVLLEAPCPPETLLTELLVMFAQLDPAPEGEQASGG